MLLLSADEFSHLVLMLSRHLFIQRLGLYEVDAASSFCFRIRNWTISSSILKLRLQWFLSCKMTAVMTTLANSCDLHNIGANSINTIGHQLHFHSIRITRPPAYSIHLIRMRSCIHAALIQNEVLLFQLRLTSWGSYNSTPKSKSSVSHVQLRHVHRI